MVIATIALVLWFCCFEIIDGRDAAMSTQAQTSKICVEQGALRCCFLLPLYNGRGQGWRSRYDLPQR